MSSAKLAPTIKHVPNVFPITAWPTKSATLLVVVQKAIHIMVLIARNVPLIAPLAFPQLNAIIVWKHFT